MLDVDLAGLYGVSTSRLNEQVKRNIERFPVDFMFQLNEGEFLQLIDLKAKNNLISQNATSRHGGRRHLPMAFTEQGIAMLSGVLSRSLQRESASVLMNEWRLLHPRLIMRALLHESFKIKICV